MLTVTPVPSSTPKPSPAHHVGNPPTSFTNPWPSCDTSHHSPIAAFKTKFARDKPEFVPVPGREELVPVRKPTWGDGQQGLKVTWIGHASFLVETTARAEGGAVSRGVRILCDPVFSERTSPVQWFGPKRYTPTPCTLEELPDVDAVVISHNHYDHMDYATIKYLHEHRRGEIHFFCGLGNASWFHGVGIPASQVTELDWWDGVQLTVPDVGTLAVTCTPSQHFSGRGAFDRAKSLWCSWVLREVAMDAAEPKAAVPPTTAAPLKPGKLHSLYFAGDTGYRSVPEADLSLAEEAKLPHCPAFAEIGQQHGPFDIALLPIGLCTPRVMMSSIHCNPSDSVCIHKDIRSKKSIGMHWGTVRGGVSQEYEDVRDPPKWWRQAAEREGLKWGEEIGLLDIGETLVVD